MVISSAGMVTITPDSGATTGTLRLHNGNGNGTLGAVEFGYSTNVDHGSIQYTGNMDFFTGDSDDSRFFISSAGLVGINTSNPEHHLHVTEPGSTREDGIVKIGGSTTALGLELRYNQAGHTTTQIVANPTYTNTQSVMKLCVDGDANADQLVLDGGGRVMMGHSTSLTAEDSIHRPLQQTSSHPGIQFRGSGTNSYSPCGSIYWGNDVSGGWGSGSLKHFKIYVHEENWHLANRNSRLVYFNVGSTAQWAYSSDERLKKDIEDIDKGLTILNQLKPRKFKWKSDGAEDVGFVAQEVKSLIPIAIQGSGEEWVAEDSEAEKDIKTLKIQNDKLIPVLVKAVQELSAEVEALKAKVGS